MTSPSRLDWVPQISGDRSGRGRDLAAQPATGTPNRRRAVDGDPGRPPNANDPERWLRGWKPPNQAVIQLPASSQAENTPRHAIPGAPLLDIPEIGRRLDVCDKTVRRFIARGDLHAYRVGRQLRVSEEDLFRFLELRS